MNVIKNKNLTTVKPQNGDLSMIRLQSLPPNASIFSNPTTQYPELRLFKTQLEGRQYGPLFQPYSASKKNTRLYKIIFFGIGIFYLLLSFFLYKQSLAWTAYVLFGSSWSIKAALCTFCGLCGASSISVGFFLRAETDAARRLYRQTKQKIKQIYRRKKTLSGIWNFLFLGEFSQTSRLAKHLFLEALEKLQVCRDNALSLIEAIGHAPTVTRTEREQLYNQAILEFKDRAQMVINNFQTSQPHTMTV